jgi:hypothetical protein
MALQTLVHESADSSSTMVMDRTGFLSLRFVGWGWNRFALGWDARSAPMTFLMHMEMMEVSSSGSMRSVSRTRHAMDVMCSKYQARSGPIIMA